MWPVSHLFSLLRQVVKSQQPPNGCIWSSVQSLFRRFALHRNIGDVLLLRLADFIATSVHETKLRNSQCLVESQALNNLDPYFSL